MKAKSSIRLRPQRDQGIAMIAALGLMAVASTVMLLLFLRTTDELRHGKDDAGIVQSLLVAQGGSNLGTVLLRSDVRYLLNDIATARSSSTGSWSFGSSSVGATYPTASSVAVDLGVVAQELQGQVNSLACGARDLGDGTTVNIRIYFVNTACGEALPPGATLGDGRFVSGTRRELGGNQTYALPFVVVSDGVQGEFRRRIVTQGEYQFEVGRRSFARYALFTDVHSAPDSGAPIWFTSNTLFDGPVHTNGHFNFSATPWFGGAVTSAGQTGPSVGPGGYGHNGYVNGVSQRQFFSAATLTARGNFPNMDTANSTNRPEFVGGVDWNSDYIALPDNAFNQRDLADANGILITGEVEFMEIFAGNSTAGKITQGQTAAYQYVTVRSRNTSGSMQTFMYRISPSGVVERRQRNTGNTNFSSGSSWALVTNSFNGVIYSDQHIPRLLGGGRTSGDNPRPAIAHFSQITLVPAAGARITGDLTYADQPCEGSLRRVGNQVVTAECNNLDATNVLGIFAPQGDITIGNPINKSSSNADVTAPRNLQLQASIMASTGVVTVENYGVSTSGDRGTVHLLGGVIEEQYGAFGTDWRSGNSTWSTGYGRSFTFDPRMGMGLTPPYFPTVGQDGVTDTRTFTFGHREQVF